MIAINIISFIYNILYSCEKVNLLCKEVISNVSADDLSVISCVHLFRDTAVMPKVVGIQLPAVIEPYPELPACEAYDGWPLSASANKGSKVMEAMTFYYNSIVV